MTRTDQNGFTLIELLVVLAIMGLIAGLAIPLGAHAVEDAALRSDARKLASAFRQMQQDARERQAVVTLAPSSDGTLSGTGPVGIPVLARGAKLRFVREGKELSFYPDGTSSGGTVRLSEHGHALDLNVAWLTGTIVLRASP